MSSSHTPNYQLSQWVRSDKVLMEDFNTDNAKIDAALKAEADVRSAAVSALEQKVNAVPLQRFASGTYTGNGQASRLIRLGFRPVIVFVWEGTGMVSCLADGHHPAIYGGIATYRASNPALSIAEDGFIVRYVVASGGPFYVTNTQGQSFSYAALG